MRKLFLIPVLALAVNSHATEFFVDPVKGSDSNPGDASSPFQTIVKALKAANPEGGDTITLKGGVYRERFELGQYGVANVKASAEKPFVIQGAAGERAIITGFEPITGWKDVGNGIYTAEVPEFINGLFVGLEAQPLARWPRDIGEWLPFGEPNEDEMSFFVEEGLDKCPDIETIAKDLRSLQMFAYVSRPAVYTTKPIKGLKPKEGTIIIDNEKWWQNYTGRDYLVLQNHPLFIKESGDWAVELKEEGGKEATVHFKPKSPKDLENVFYRTRGILASLRGVSGVVIRNIEFSGAGRSSIEIGGSDCIVESCIVHNGFGGGISSRNSKDITIRNNIVVNNEDSGISVQSTETALVEGNQIAFNMVDGLRVVGNASGRNDGESDSTNVTVRRNYMHHHFYMSHPDNMQTFRGVSGLKMEDNVLLFGGQNTMTEQNSDSEMRGNVSLFTEAFIVIFGHRSAHRWLVEGNTFGYGGWGSFLMDGEGYQFFDNVFIGTGLATRPEMKSDHNVFVTRPWTRTILRVGHTSHTDMAAAREASDTDAKSLAIDDWPFKNMPKAFSITHRKGEQGKEPGKTDWVVFRTQGGGGTIGKAADYAVGDNIEINGDGIMRKVTTVEDTGIQFAPALPTAPFRGVFVLNWGEATSTQLDLALVDPSHPIMTAGRDGKRAGSSLDIAEFQRGELLEKGKRTLPAIPEDLQAAWPNPNYYIPPMHGR